jgi:thioredoxin-dependent peroxiredoxin
MIGPGDAAPDFQAADTSGRTFRFSSLRGRPVILFFFPKAFTAGCTAETRQFGELAPPLAEQGVQVVGISVDTSETLGRFQSHCAASFPLLSDASKEIARRYGVLSILGMSKRATFFVDAGGTVEEVVVSLLPGPHLRSARARYLGGS